MDPQAALSQEATEASLIVPVRRPLWRRTILNPASIAFAVLALLIWAAILVAPNAGAAGGCGGG